MSDRGLIVGGLVLFLGLVTLPVWYNVAAGRTAKPPELTLPTQAKSCVAPVEYMRASHMDLLMTWRDDVVRQGERTFVGLDGKTYAKSLTGTCMACHVNRAEFCDRCHDYAAVTPTCWECHLESRQVQRTAR
ncbi:MAG: sulfate reduction electron transfer complex DsrMKJOP subunit DsrJ [Candidatus Rokubacteria bacterium]|nr:sulfate reduction electron transfer complex DsrMKJOP subunit DsrJ [Candidatus Rokubacteria bacterium]